MMTTRNLALVLSGGMSVGALKMNISPEAWKALREARTQNDLQTAFNRVEFNKKHATAVKRKLFELGCLTPSRTTALDLLAEKRMGGNYQSWWGKAFPEKDPQDIAKKFATAATFEDKVDVFVKANSEVVARMQAIAEEKANPSPLPEAWMKKNDWKISWSEVKRGVHELEYRQSEALPAWERLLEAFDMLRLDDDNDDEKKLLQALKEDEEKVLQEGKYTKVKVDPSWFGLNKPDEKGTAVPGDLNAYDLQYHKLSPTPEDVTIPSGTDITGFIFTKDGDNLKVTAAGSSPATVDDIIDTITYRGLTYTNLAQQATLSDGSEGYLTHLDPDEKVKIDPIWLSLVQNPTPMAWFQNNDWKISLEQCQVLYDKARELHDRQRKNPENSGPYTPEYRHWSKRAVTGLWQKLQKNLRTVLSQMLPRMPAKTEMNVERQIPEHRLWSNPAVTIKIPSSQIQQDWLSQETPPVEKDGNYIVHLESFPSEATLRRQLQPTPSTVYIHDSQEATWTAKEPLPEGQSIFKSWRRKVATQAE